MLKMHFTFLCCQKFINLVGYQFKIEIFIEFPEHQLIKNKNAWDFLPPLYFFNKNFRLTNSKIKLPVYHDKIVLYKV